MSSDRLNVARLAWTNVVGSPLRSLMILLCVAMIAGAVICATLVVRGAQAGFRAAVAGMEHSEADISIVPSMSNGPMTMSMMNLTALGPMGDIAAMPGVAVASAQIRAAVRDPTAPGSPRDLLLLGFDPATDFSVLPWLPQRRPPGLQVDEALLGSQVELAPGAQTLAVFDHELKVVGRLAPSGTDLDRSVCITFETLHLLLRLAQYPSTPGVDVARAVDTSGSPLMLVRLRPGADPAQVAARILEHVPNVIVFDKATMFRRARAQLGGLLRSVPAALAVLWALSVAVIGLVFSVAVNERRREIGVLRALGATRATVLRTVLAEGALLAVAGGALGVTLAALAVLLFRDGIVAFIGLPLAPLSAPSTLLLPGTAALILALVSVPLAALLPALRLIRREPAATMRA